MGISRFFTSLFYKKHDKHIFVVLMVISISFVLCAYYDNHPGVGSKNSSGELSEYRKRHLEKHIKHGLGNNQNAKGFEMFQKDIVINKNRRLQGGLKFSNQTAKLDMAIQQYMKARGNNDMDNMELIMVPENLKTPDKQKWNYNVNSKVSDLIPINRVAPDLRWSGCKNIVYDTESLPKMTIVIPFYNEVSFDHYSDVIMSMMASQITSVSVVCSSVCSGTNHRKHRSSASLASVRGIHRGPVNSPHKGPVTRKCLIWWRHHESYGKCFPIQLFDHWQMC